MDRNSTPLLRRLHPELFRDEAPKPAAPLAGRTPVWVERAKARTLTAKELSR
jgi:hypothetical protein